MSPVSEIHVSVADMAPMKRFITATVGLVKSLAECKDLPQPVMDAADEVRRAVAELGGRDIGPPP